MITLKFHSEMDLFHFMVVTGTYDNWVDYEQLVMHGELTDAELELAFKAFNVDIVAFGLCASPTHVTVVRSLEGKTEWSLF
jgi:hypothetical protein